MNVPGDLPPEPEPAPAPTPAEKFPFWGYQDVFLFAAMALPLLLVSFLLVNGVFLVAHVSPRARIVQLLAAQFLFYLLWFLFLWGWLRLRYGRPFWRSLAFVVPRQGLWPSLGWGVALAAGVVAAGALLHPPEVELPLMQMLNSQLAIFLVGTFAVTLGPLFEELAFRGFLQPLLVNSLTVAPGIAITAALFASLHGPEYAWSWKHLLLVTLAGAGFGWMRHRTGSTATAAVMHAAYNMMFFVGMVLGKNTR
jgi:membrane protease YdiL (CAAX protease family)